MLPVLLRVSVPKDCPAGDYRGMAVVSVAGTAPVAVPIELSVAGWIVPEPKDYRTYVGVYQSPTTLALKYNVPEWSEEHWKLMEKSFALLARVGNRLVNVPVADKTQFGNDDGMIYWRRRGDGSYTYDFTVFDRFLDLAVRHFPSLEFVVLHVWHSGGWDTRGADQENTVTLLDKTAGRREHLRVPRFGTEASKLFWKPFFDAVRERLAHRGLEKTLCLGILSDGTAPRGIQGIRRDHPRRRRWMRAATRPPAARRPTRSAAADWWRCTSIATGSGCPTCPSPCRPTGSSASGRGPTTTGSPATKAWCRSAGTGTRA